MLWGVLEAAGRGEGTGVINDAISGTEVACESANKLGVGTCILTEDHL